MTTAGTQTIRVVDLTRPSFNGPSLTTPVVPAGASQLVLGGVPLFGLTGTTHAISVTAEDPYGNRVTSFTDAVSLNGTSHTFTAGEQGVHTYMTTLPSSGVLTLTASDTTHTAIPKATAKTVVVSSAVALTPDVDGSGASALVILAPASGGTVLIVPTNSTGTTVAVSINGKAQTVPTSSGALGHIYVYGQGGNLVVQEQSATINHHAEKLNQDDPANVVWLRDIALASLRRSEAQLRGHDLAAVRQSLKRSIEVTDQLLKKDAASVPLRIDRAVICTRLADLAAREGNFAQAEQWYAQDLQTLRQLQKEGKLQGAILESMRARADLGQRAFRLAPSVVPGEEPIAANDMQGVLVALRGLALARQGRHAAAVICAEQLRASAANQADHYAAIARVYSLCAADAPSSPGGKDARDESSARRLRYRDAAMAALTEAVRNNPGYEVCLEPDFDVLRSETRYHQLVHRSQ